VPLALLTGPANAGKVASLLDRYVAALDREPFLVVPNRGEVERIERDLLRRAPVLLGGRIGTFADLERLIALGSLGEKVLSPLQQMLLLRRIVTRSPLAGLETSARYAGFVETLRDALAELETGLVEPEEVDGEIGRLYRAYRAELERLGALDGELVAARAARLVTHHLDAWSGSPVYVYGFEDLSGAQWGLLEGLAARADVVVSLPYEPSRPAFAVLERTANDLAALARDAIQELPAQDWYESPELGALERVLFDDGEHLPLQASGGIRFIEAAGKRAALELVADEILRLFGDGVSPDDVGVVVPSAEAARVALESAFASFGVPYVVEAPARFSRTPLGRAALGLLRFAWLDGGRSDLFAFLRSRFSGLARHRADFVEGRLRGRGVADPARVEEETTSLLGHRPAMLDALRESPSPVEAVDGLVRSMLRAAHGLHAPPTGEVADADLRAGQAALDVLDQLREWEQLGGPPEPGEIVAALERSTTRPVRDAEGRVTVLDLLRARTRRFGIVFVLGMEEGVLPRRATETPFLTDDLRRDLEALGGDRRRLARADQVVRDRYLFYTACTRPWRRLYLVREAANDEGRPLEPSPFYEEVRSRFAAGDVDRWTRRRPLSALTWELHEAATVRERVRAVAQAAAESEATGRSLAAGGGWTRQLERALAAFARPTGLVNPRVRERFEEQSRFGVTELEAFGDCSSIWFVERIVDPRPIDGRSDPRLSGQVAHQALYRFYSGLPRRFGMDHIDPERIDEAVEFLHECLAEALTSQVRLELGDTDRLELEGTLARDLEHFVRQDAALELPLVPRRFEVSFGSERAAPELQRGLELGDFTVSGKMDRIDVDPFSARGIVQDYKSGKAQSAARIDAEGRLQVPLYILALRDLVGIEPLGGLYRSLSREREARGLLREEYRDDVPGFADNDYLSEEAFWDAVAGAEERARQAVARVRRGDVRHDPRGGRCPSWCDRWPICRVERA